MTEEKDILQKIIKKLSGSIKLKSSGVWLNLLKGDLDKTYAFPKISICVDDVNRAVKEGCYTWRNKEGKIMLPVQVKLWESKEKSSAIESNANITIHKIDDEIPF